MLHVGHDQPDRRIDARIERHDEPGHAEIAGDAAGMQRPGAAEGEQHEVAQIVAAHGRDRLDGLLHLDLDDAHDAFRGLDGAELASGRATLLGDRRRARPRSSRILPPRKLSSLR